MRYTDAKVKPITQFDSGTPIPFPFVQPVFKGLPLVRVYLAPDHRQFYAYQKIRENLISFCHPDVGVLLLDKAEYRFQQAIWSADATRSRVLVNETTFWQAYEEIYGPLTPVLPEIRRADCWI